MLNIYYQKDLEIGYDYYSFKTRTYTSEFTKYEYESQLKNDLENIKYDLIMFNMEDFIVRFNEADIQKNELQNTALNRLHDFLVWGYDEKVSLSKACKNLVKMEQFIITIVNAYKGEERQRAIKEWCFVMKFLTKELKK